MPDTTGTLDLIDHAIRDWETSPDAMRWGPEVKPPEPSPYDALYAQLQSLGEVTLRMSVVLCAESD